LCGGVGSGCRWWRTSARYIALACAFACARPALGAEPETISAASRRARVPSASAAFDKLGAASRRARVPTASAAFDRLAPQHDAPSAPQDRAQDRPQDSTIGPGSRGDEREARGDKAIEQDARVSAPATRVDVGRFSAIAYGADTVLARRLLEEAASRDSFPGLPRPSEHVLIAVAPDKGRFRAWAGPAAPEWGAGLAFPDAHRIVLQGHTASSAAGNPSVTLRHELAHLALHEFFKDDDATVPRWFDEGYACYAAGEVGRDDALAANVALAIKGTPSLAAVDSGLTGTALEADASYALAYRAVADLAARDPQRGLTLLFGYWKDTGSLDRAVRGAYGEPLETFERDWRSRVRRRYGALALVTDLSAASLLLLLVMAPLYVARRRRDRARLQALRAAEEAAEAQERRDAIDALLATLPRSPGGTN
jgi:Peptidase MA superfamily